MARKLVFRVVLSGVLALVGRPVAATAAPVIPVDACGAVLSVPAGHYVLRQNLACGATEPFAVTIVASDVRLDLEGHRIDCADLGGATTAGVYVPPGFNLTGLWIGGGTISGCVQGVSLGNVHQSQVSGMMLDDNLALGLLLVGSNDNRISGNSMSRNNVAGCILVSSSRNHFTGNFMNDNIQPGCAIPGVPAGLAGSDDNVFSGNEANGNGNAGLSIGPHSTGNIVSGNTTFFNGLSGISVFGRIAGGVIVLPIPEGNLVQGNTSFGNVLNDLSEILFDASDRSQSVGVGCLNTWKSNDFGAALGPDGCID